MTVLEGKTAIVTGASRGIGLAIALKLATCGANLVILSKDTEEKMQETRGQFKSLGKEALVLKVDVSDVNEMKEAIAQAVDQFGGIDVLINNTSATCFENTLNLQPEKFDLMMATSARAAFFLSQYCIPHLKKAANPHIINISPPLNLESNCFKDYLGFSISKYAMSLCTLGMAKEFMEEGIAVNSLWPRSTIATQTIKDHFSSKVYSSSRFPSIMADATCELLLQPSESCSGHFFIDEELLRNTGKTDFSDYAVDSNAPLMQALFTPADEEMVSVSSELFQP